MTKRLYIGHEKEPFTDAEREKLKKLRFANDNKLSCKELREKQILMNKILYQTTKQKRN